MGKIFYCMGKSSAGKDTIYKALADDDSLNLKNIVIYTTRPIREGEADGTEYFFVSENELNNLMLEDKVIELREYNTVHGIWKYFTVDDGQINADDNYIMIGTLESFNKLKNYYGEDIIVPIYIEVDDGIRLERALKREKNQTKPKYEEMCRRFLADQKDFSEENIKNAGIKIRFYNDELQKCIKSIKAYIEDVLNS